MDCAAPASTTTTISSSTFFSTCYLNSASVASGFKLSYSYCCSSYSSSSYFFPLSPKALKLAVPPRRSNVLTSHPQLCCPLALLSKHGRGQSSSSAPFMAGKYVGNVSFDEKGEDITEQASSSSSSVFPLSHLFEFFCAGTLLDKIRVNRERVIKNLDESLSLGVKLSRLLGFNELQLSHSQKLSIYHYFVPAFFWCKKELVDYRSQFKEGELVPALVGRDDIECLCQSTYNKQSYHTVLIGSPTPEKAGCIWTSQERRDEFSSENRHKSGLFLLGLQGLLPLLQTKDAEASEIFPVYGDVASLVEVGVQVVYLGSLLVLLGVGSFLVVRQVLFRRELEYAAKDLQDRVRTGKASPMEYFELGAVMLRKKFYGLATKYLDQAIKKWDGDEQDLAQVYNALGFSYFSDGKLDSAISHYQKAVSLSPGYVTAWNNLGNAYEKKKDWSQAYKAYEQSLQFDPDNKVALACRDAVKERLERFKGVPSD